MTNWDSLTEFERAYIQCLLWSETNEDGEPFDACYGYNDLADEAVTAIIKDCKDFCTFHGELLNDSGLSIEQAGHDFCLTRNGHGAGFWDRDLGVIGDKLTDACKPYSTQGLYLGDDGKLYTHN